jgi:hypothetical protein
VRAALCNLLGEHLGRDGAEVEAALADGAGLLGAVERLNGRSERRLVPFSMDPRARPAGSDPGHAARRPGRAVPPGVALQPVRPARALSRKPAQAHSSARRAMAARISSRLAR